MLGVGLLLGSTSGSAFALSKEAAIENCRMTVGKPIVQACMRASGGAGNLEACRTKATPQVRACVMAALNAANGRANVAVAIPTEAAPKASSAPSLSAGFIAPPRTVSDITAILDSEKPDLKKIEKLKANAEDEPTGKESKQELAKFYFDGGSLAVKGSPGFVLLPNHRDRSGLLAAMAPPFVIVLPVKLAAGKCRWCGGAP
jgi:hypothetical protein